MSYSFTVTKDADGIRLDDVSEGALANIPDGVFTVNGHVPGEGTSAVGSIGIQLTAVAPFREYLAGASGNYNVRPAKPEPAAND